MKKFFTSFGLFWFFLIIAILVIDYVFFLRATIGHDGMSPTLLQGEMVMMSKGVDEVEVGDILICPDPRGNGAFVLGRALAKPGMTIGTKRPGLLEVEGTVAEQDFLGKMKFADAGGIERDMTYGYEKIGNSDYLVFDLERSPWTMSAKEVKTGVFLLSDNRLMSQHDSRTFGEVDPATCLGKVFMRLKNAEGRDFEADELERGFLSFIK